MSSSTPPRTRRLDGWGFSGEAFPPSPQMLAWLEERLGKGEPFPALDPSSLPEAPAPRTLPDFGLEVSTDPRDRLAHSRGRGFTDLLRLRSGTVPALPDGVARPVDDDALARLLERAAEHDVRVIPWGGGTSVTGGVNVIPDPRPAVTVDLERLAGLLELDETSGLATVAAGTFGPALEAALGERGWTLGHFPQSFELSTLGGWIATRSAGQESLGYGRIDDLVAGIESTAPGGRLTAPTLPASAAGPDLRRLLLGSEGRFGIITRATMRVRPKPAMQRVEAVLVPTWMAGIEAARELVQSGVPLGLLRLSDGPETEVAMSIGLAKSRFAAIARAWLRLRGIGPGACLLLVGASGDVDGVDLAFELARLGLRRHGAVWLGAGPGRHWLADRFRHPYLRDGLFDTGYATDTFETAAPWSRLDALYAAVKRSFEGANLGDEREVPVLCHLSHPYRDGASLYFTFFFRCNRDPEAAAARWADLKRRATDALVEAGGALSHHHGVGSWHAPWLARETGADGVRVLSRVAEELDPAGVLNPHVLLDPVDRLTV